MSAPPVTRHIPVLLNEVVDALQPRDGGRYVDGTFGAGGYSAALLAAAAAVRAKTAASASAVKRREGRQGRPLITTHEKRAGPARPALFISAA